MASIKEFVQRSRGRINWFQSGAVVKNCRALQHCSKPKKKVSTLKANLLKQGLLNVKELTDNAVADRDTGFQEHTTRAAPSECFGSALTFEQQK